MKACASLKLLSLQISLAAALPRAFPQGPEDAIAFTSGSLVYETIESTTSALVTSSSVCTSQKTSTVTGTVIVYETIDGTSTLAGIASSSTIQGVSSPILTTLATSTTSLLSFPTSSFGAAPVAASDSPTINTSLKTTLTTSEVQTFSSLSTAPTDSGVSLFRMFSCLKYCSSHDRFSEAGALQSCFPYRTMQYDAWSSGHTMIRVLTYIINTA